MQLRLSATTACWVLTTFVLLVCASLATAQTPGLMAAYGFNEGSGTTVTDISGNNNTGTISGATWTSQGRFGSALSFDGVNDLVVIAASPTLNVTTAMTLSAWVFPTATQSGWRTIMQREIDAYFLNASNSNGPLFPSGGGTFSGGGNYLSGNASLPVNAWTHVALTWDGATMRLYVNGSQVASTPQSGVLETNNSPLRIGGNVPYGEYFQGRIDEVRVYNRALTQVEIQSDINTPVGGTPPPPDTVSPSAPTGLAATAASSTQINLGWTASSDNVGVTGYRVERCQGLSCTNFAQVAAPTATSFSNTSLAPATSYSYRVLATDSAGNVSGYSNIASATTQTASDTTAPTAPSGLAATAVSTSQIDLTWIASTDNVGVSGYRVERCQGTNCTNFAQVGTPTTTSFSDAGLASNTNYRFRVRAVDAAGNLSLYSNIASARTQAPDTTRPTAPAGLTANAVNSSQINLSWSASTDNVGVTGYQVERCQGASCTAFVQIATTTGTNLSDTGLLAATTYRYRVRATDAAGNLSTYSSIASATTQAGPDTTAPTVMITTPTTGATFSTSTSPLTLGGTASDNVGVTQITWGNDRGGNGTASGTTSWSASGIILQLGTNVLTATAHDAANNMSAATLTVTYTPPPDSTGPTVAITSHTNNQTVTSSPITVSGTASDSGLGNNGISSVTVNGVAATGGTATGSGTANWSRSVPLNPGANTITVVAKDASTNQNSTMVSITVNYTAADNTGPAVAITSHTNNQTVTSSPITVSGTASDSGLGNNGISSVTVNGVAATGGTATGSGTANWSRSVTLNPGANTITVVAKDASTNQNSTMVSITVNYTAADNTGPAVAITSHTNNQTVTSSPITVSGTASDSGLGNNGISSVTVNGVAATGGTATGSGTANWSSSVTLNPGANTITVVAKDASTNQNSTMVSITVNYSAPSSGGLVAAYGFNEGTGTTVTDTSANNNTGTISGATWSGQWGQYGTALSFGVANDFVSIPNSASLDIGGKALTIEFWAKIIDIGSDYAILAKPWTAGTMPYPYYQYAVEFDGNGGKTLDFLFGDAGGQLRGPFSVTPVIGSWTHVAFTYDGANVKGYLDGVQQSVSAETSTMLARSNDLLLGVDGAFGQGYVGLLDEVRIYNRALTQSEIQADMNTPIGGAPGGDTSPPTAPANLAAAANGSSQINLSWTASTDNVGVIGYQVERCQGAGCSNFAQIGTPSGTTYNDTGLAANTTYSYRVRATDAAGNLSGYSNIASATTTQTPADATPPTAPVNLVAAANGSSQINLSWTASTDNVGVTGYQVERCQGAGCSNFAQIGTPSGTTYNDTGLAANTTYSYRVRATDAASNLSGYSNIGNATTSSAPQITGLVVAFGFNEGSGTTVSDVSGNNNTGTITGATWTTQGRFGSALSFNGVNSVVRISTAASLNLTSAMTLEAWIKPTASQSGWRTIMQRETDAYFLNASNDSGPLLPSGGGVFGGMATYVSGTTANPVNAWTHVALTYNGATLRLYVNGALAASQARTGSIQTNSNPLWIGGNSPYGEYFQGLIDEIRVYNRALSQAEIQADMNTPVGDGTPPAPDTIPPTVSITVPLSNATVESTITVAASASDNVDVVGVQFFLDGAPLGSEIPFSPFSVVWDTTTATPGSHTLTARARDAAGNATTSTPVPVTVRATTVAVIGQWSAPANWPLVAVHTTLLPTGDVLAWDGANQNGAAFIWHPSNNTFTSRNPPDNIFCAGHCFLPDGRLLVVGGNLATFAGLPDANIFNPTTNSWTQVRSMSYGRWYPTAITLPDGRVLVVAGDDGCHGCVAAIPEIYNAATNTWVQLTDAANPLPEYPHLFVLPDGRILATGSFELPIAAQVLDLNTQTWTVVDPTVLDGHSSVMYRLNKFMKSGTSANSDPPYGPSAPTTYVLDMTQAQPAWRETSPMAFPRSYHTLTLLPDGSVLATGGGRTTDPFDQANAVLTAELWSPATETWTTAASMTIPRLYHSNALLFPDGRVLIAGGGRFGGGAQDDQLNAEIYSPPYLFKGSRPAIASAPNLISYNSSFSVNTPDAARIASVALIPLGSVTHDFNANQRYLSLTFQNSGTALSIQAPANANIAPPGYYMLFIVDTNGVPSVAATLRIQ